MQGLQLRQDEGNACTRTRNFSREGVIELLRALTPTVQSLEYYLTKKRCIFIEVSARSFGAVLEIGFGASFICAWAFGSASGSKPVPTKEESQAKNPITLLCTPFTPHKWKALDKGYPSIHSWRWGLPDSPLNRTDLHTQLQCSVE
ncbi:hypothetical protein OUZ56_024255 [Daphnia magna]|uniref:Uncharacterized protein n=1 Tax=Daphnia magna TaxID=35525 RepID=A0ABR0B0G3_9CRUS|nr:hypothetical protein OUZ56_024255 [Daphnia magna]